MNWQEVPAGRLLGPDSRGSASQQPLQSSEGTLEEACAAAAFSAVPATFAAHCSLPWGGPHTIPVAAPVQSPFDVPVTWKGRSASAAALDDHTLRWSAHTSLPGCPKSGVQPAAAHRKPPTPQPLPAPKASPGLKGVTRKPVSARCSSPRERAARTRACGRPVRLEADARRGKLCLVRVLTILRQLGLYCNWEALTHSVLCSALDWTARPQLTKISMLPYCRVQSRASEASWTCPAIESWLRCAMFTSR